MLIPREWLCAILSISRCLASSSNSRSVRCAIMADSLCICRTSSLPIKSDRAVWSPDFRRASRLLVADRKSSCLTVAAYCISCACSASENSKGLSLLTLRIHFAASIRSASLIRRSLTVITGVPSLSSTFVFSIRFPFLSK